MKVNAQLESWSVTTPFRITGHVWERVDLVRVTLEQDGRSGQGEALGVYYRNDTPASILEQIRSIAPAIENGIDRESACALLPPGGARNALDCALWDLEAKSSGRPVWQLVGLEEPRPLLTTFTCGADAPEVMAQRALSYANARALKLKLTGDPLDMARVREVREARPDVLLGVDANQGFNRESFERLLPVLVDARVSLIEQPFPIGHDALLDGCGCPIPVAADESAQSLADLAGLVGRYQVVNIKLDKCGGLTEGLAMARAAREFGLEVMVGNMLGTSLAMAPAFLLGQLCSVIDLDGPVFLRIDRQPAVEYIDGYVRCPPALWGYP